MRVIFQCETHAAAGEHPIRVTSFRDRSMNVARTARGKGASSRKTGFTGLGKRNFPGWQGDAGSIILAGSGRCATVPGGEFRLRTGLVERI
jgi:hypothetical protein